MEIVLEVYPLSLSIEIVIFLESPNTEMLQRDLLLITHNYTQSNSVKPAN